MSGALLPLERIVRPFETANINPPVQAPDRIGPTEKLENIVIKIGEQGQVKTMQGSGSSSISAFRKTENREINRDVTERRVENPDDPNQYVNVEDTNRIEIESGRRDNYTNEDITFAKDGVPPPDPGNSPITPLPPKP